MRRDVGEVYVQMFDVALANWVGEPPSLCVHSETCGLALALEHTGDLYSCDHFVEPRYKLGNIKERHMLELVASPQQRQFGLDKRDTLPALLPRMRRPLRLPRRLPEGPLHRRRPTASPGLNYLCAGYKDFFHHVDGPMRIMAERLARGDARRPRSSRSTRPRTRSAGETTVHVRLAAASGSTATEPRHERRSRVEGTRAAAEPDVAPARAGLVLGALIAVAAVANLGLAVANVALPSIGQHFDASQTSLNLIAVGYSLGLAASVL